jgi:ribonucleoside-triphosphate reductase
VNEELFEIILVGGRRLITTHDHRMPTGDRGKVFVSDLSPDDKLNVNCNLPCDKEIELYKGFGDDVSLSYLLGLYAAEGTTWSANSDRHVHFCFGAHEHDLIKKCKDLISICFNYEAKWNYVNNKKGCQVSIHSNAIYDWFSKIGIGMKGYDMRIPPMLFSAKKECKMAFLLGYYRGDGTFRLNGKAANQRRIEMNTISEEFAEGLLLLSGSLGFNFKYGIYKDKREGRKTRHILTLNEYSEIKKFFAGIFSEHLDIWVKIRKINLIPYSGPVYDIVEVEKKQLFVTGQGVVSSNCAYQFNSNSETDSAFDDKLQFIDGQHFSMGSWQVVTLNLPRLAYKAKNYEDFINEAQRLINSCVPVFRYKRECMQKMINNHSLGFLQQRMMKDGNISPVYADFDSLVYTIGVIGLNEVVAILSGTGIETIEGSKLALKICAELKKHCKTMSEFLGSTIAFARTPAETTGQRFAYLDFKAGYDVICQGDKEEAFKLQEMGISDVPIYYTNGTHVPPAANVMPSERLRIEQAFFPVLDGGNITHIWLGEQSPSVGGLKDMAMKICKTNCGYFSFTRDFTTRTRFYRLYKQ